MYTFLHIIRKILHSQSSLQVSITSAQKMLVQTVTWTKMPNFLGMLLQAGSYPCYMSLSVVCDSYYFTLKYK
jgi:hypothetical protein